MSATRTLSLTLWIDSLTTPSSMTRAHRGLRERARLGQKRVAGYEPVERVIDTMAFEQRLDGRLQGLDRLFGREADIEARLQFPGDHVRSARAGRQVRDLETRRLKRDIALIPSPRGQFRERGSECMNRIVGGLR